MGMWTFFIPDRVVGNHAGNTGTNWGRRSVVMCVQAGGEMREMLKVLRLPYMLFIFV